jgi:hypothetical protein
MLRCISESLDRRGRHRRQKVLPGVFVPGSSWGRRKLIFLWTCRIRSALPQRSCHHPALVRSATGAIPFACFMNSTHSVGYTGNHPSKADFQEITLGQSRVSHTLGVLKTPPQVVSISTRGRMDLSFRNGERHSLCCLWVHVTTTTFIKRSNIRPLAV